MMEERSPRVNPSLWGAICCALPCLVLAMAVATQWSARYALDDSLMFLRYADHVLLGEGLVWNPGDDPIYGPTSLAFVVVVAMVRMFTVAPAMAVQLASLLCGFVFVGAVVWLARELGRPRGIMAIVVTLAGLALWSDSLSAHFTTGMDTTFAMAFLAVYLIAAHATMAGGTRASWMTALVGGAALAARPELCLFTVIVPLSVVVYGPRGTSGLWLKILIATVGIFLLHAFVAWGSLGTPLPLSFYTKSINGYGAVFAAEYGHVALAEFVDFASGYWLLIVPIAIDLCFKPEWRNREMALERGVLVATVTFLFYHLFMTLPIMPYKERFFQPAVPALIFLSAGAVSRFPVEAGVLMQGVRARFPIIATLLVMSILSPAAVASAKALRKGIQAGVVGEFDLVHTYRTTGVRERWFALDRFSDLPDDVVIAATEIGLLVALNPDKRIVDMAGLNHRAIATQGFSPDHLFAETPDLIFLPHPHYEAMIRALEVDGRLRRDYDVIDGESIGTHFGIALRKTSSYYDRMRLIVEAEKPSMQGSQRAQGE